MTEYRVTVPIVGVAFVVVDAQTKKEAIEKALEEVELSGMEEWSPFEEIVSGNCLNFSTPNRIEVDEQ
jgi:hypothetical protein